MILEQEHIINKVFLDVETNSVTLAHTLKDRLDMFLKEEILPYLENYFKSIEQNLPAEIVQIDQLHLEIQASDYNDFENLKTNTKEKIVEKIEAMLQTPSQTNEMVLINTKESQERSLLFFIEHGNAPWWTTTNSQLQYTIQDIKEISAHSNFSNKFIQLLRNPISKKRCVLQFTDQELVMLLKATFHNSKESTLLTDKIIHQITSLSSLSRVFVWNEIITYLQSKNEKTLIVQLYTVLSKSTNTVDKSVYAFAKAVLAILQEVCIIKKESITTLSQEKVKDISQKEETLVSHLLSICIKTNLSTEVHSFLKSIQKSVPSIYKQLEKSVIKKEVATTPEIEDNVSTKAAKNQVDISDKKTPEELNKKDDSSRNTPEIPLQENNLDIQENNSNQTETTTQKQIDANSTTSIQNKEDKSTQETTDVINRKSQEGEKPNSFKENDSEININENTTSQKDAINTPQLEAKIVAQEQKNNNQNREATSPNMTSQKEKETNASISDKNITKQPEQISKPLMDTHIQDLLPQDDIQASNSGTHYVKNAGLIIVHPYLSHFFTNCGLLDDNNTITDQETAIHALHYIATKKEQQLENNMVFEKFLCGVPIQKTIQRQIVLSDHIKEQAEELLQSVVENWGVLNNASSDLVRHEFLQRQGKLSFTEDNPKVVIERKTQDILVDKLPWGIGICKLPWLDQLVFTNW